MSTPTDPFEKRFDSLERSVREDAVLAPELEASAADFFQGRFDPRRAAPDDLARRRHLEWFLLERTSPSLPGLAIQRLAEEDPKSSGLDDPEFLAGLMNSHAGVFEVSSVKPGEGMWLRDLASLGEYPVLEPEAAAVLEKGDLIAGRMFPSVEGAYRLSRAAAFHRNRPLLDALRGDLERARSTRRGVVRVGQRELESMFFAADPAGAPADPVGDARKLLLESGIERAEVEAWLEDLAQTPFERENLVIGMDDALGPILDRLAFESGVDLDAARRSLMHAWDHLTKHGPGRGASLTPGEGRRVNVARKSGPKSRGEIDAARALAEFEKKRKAGVPLDDVFDELERELALDEEEGDGGEIELEDGEGAAPARDAEELSPVPDFPGVVSAMITEFLWETGRDAGAVRAEDMAGLESFGRFAHHIGVFENLSTRDLLTYTTFWLPESGGLESGDQARALLTALGTFLRWADETQDLSLHADFGETLNALKTTLPRIVEANRRRTRAADRTQGELYEILDAGGRDARVRDRTGGEHGVEIEPDLASWLRAGDRVRANRLDDGRLAVYCVYPPEARGLTGHAPRTSAADESGAE
jgi:hypothetical protein